MQSRVRPHGRDAHVGPHPRSFVLRTASGGAADEQFQKRRESVMFTRIAIVNRGEAAMRLIHAVRGLSAETGQPIEVVALHTDVDRNATFVREADIAYNLGAAADRPYPVSYTHLTLPTKRIV